MSNDQKTILYTDLEECHSKLVAISDLLTISLQSEIPIKQQALGALDMLFGEQLDLLKAAGEDLYEKADLNADQSSAMKTLIAAQAREIELLNRLLDSGQETQGDAVAVPERKAAYERRNELLGQAQKLAAGELRIVS